MKPNLIILGAMKAGTTSFHPYLNAHPDIAMSEPKETNYFSNLTYWKRGNDWYESHFTRDAKIRGESSTAYSAYPIIPDVPERIHRTVPRVKLIYLVRDPITRLISQFLHHTAEAKETRDLSTIIQSIIRDEPSPYVFQSQYMLQLERYLEFFSCDQILVITTESLKTAKLETLNAVCEFLEIPFEFSAEDVKKDYNQTESEKFQRNWWVNFVFPPWLQTHPRLPWKIKSPFYRLARLGATKLKRPNLTDGQVATLIDVFRSDVHKLREYTQLDLSEWRDY